MMKIGQKPELTAAALQAETASKQSAKPAAAQEAAKSAQVAIASTGVPVSISNTAKALQPEGRATADFDAERVKAMRESIANGTFQVNAEAIADKLLANASEFLTHSMDPRPH